jgi:hypothetical protein
MAERHLELLNLEPGRAQTITDLLESYANTTERERGSLEEGLEHPELTAEDTERPDIYWMLTMDIAYSLRGAASWAVYFDVGRSFSLLRRAGRLYQDAGLAFGSFLLTVAGRPPLDELPRDVTLLAQLHGQAISPDAVEIPSSLHHPQQQAYMLLACAGMAQESGSVYRQQLQRIAAESPNRLGVLPFGALGTPVRVPWDVGVHLLQTANPESLNAVARHLAVWCQRYSEVIELAMVNDHLWNHAAAPVDVGDFEVMGIAALSASHFGADEITEAITSFGISSDDISFIPFDLGIEIFRRSAGSFEE